MTWTSAFGRACGWLLDHIVHGLALTRISPNALTFFGLVINIAAAFLFGHANASNGDRMFFYAGMVIFGAGIFDMVDGRVARRNNQVTVFGSFFDSVIDRYSDVVLFFGLLVYYGRINRFRYVVLVAFVMVTSLMVSYTRARAEALIGQCKVGFMERPERIVLILLGALFNHWGVMAPGVVGAGRALDHHGCAPDYLYLLKDQTFGADWVSVSLQDRFMVVGFVSFK
jgi:CDP-diacylglycerol--glycerol-3-phosphate 3-phosphatidyltransferase